MKLENLSNFYLVNKPQNWTSQDLCTVFKRQFSFSKVGHSGTLDPNASGLMLLATNKYTKLFDYLKDTNKTYEFEALFGYESDSFDIDTDVRKVDSINLNLLQDELQKGINSLTGKIKQTPPIYSAIKVDGKRLYKYARQDKNVDIPERVVEVTSFNLLNFENNKAKFSATVSKGTFIRSLAVDLANYLGTKAVVSSIVRTDIGDLNIENSVTIDKIDKFPENDYPIPLEWTKLFNLPVISVNDELVKEIKNGNFLPNDIFNENNVSIIENKNTILAIYEPYNKNKFKPQKVLI
ncbi:MAG: tRNA pseudouridine(55) synthase TruB [Candidatus Actinomarina sp.]